MNPIEDPTQPTQPQTPVGGEHLEKDYYERYNSLFDLEMLAGRIEEITLPEEIGTHLKEQESNNFLVLGSATAKNINGVTKIAHHLHGKEATLKDSVTIVDINDTSIALHDKAIKELDEVSDWTHTSTRQRSSETFPYPEFKLEKGDIRSLTQEADSVDIALSDYTVNYLDSKEDISSFFNEVKRVLKEKGILYIALRYSKEGQSQQRITQGGIEMCTFSLDEYMQLAVDAGLQVVAKEWGGTKDTLIVFGKSKVDGDESLKHEKEPGYVQTFDELAALGSVQFGGGTEVSFQPHGRYEEGRQTGTVRLWADAPDVISINFMGSKVGIKQPDNERITKENFDQRKDTWKIRKVESC